MSQQPDSLSEDDVRQITQLVDALERSSFDYLQVQSGNLRVTVGREGFVPPAAQGFNHIPAIFLGLFHERVIAY